MADAVLSQFKQAEEKELEKIVSGGNNGTE